MTSSPTIIITINFYTSRLDYIQTPATAPLSSAGKADGQRFVL